MTYSQMSAEERKAEYARLQKEFDDLKAKGLNLNMARGKPSKQQIDQANGLFDLMRDPADYVADGIDVRTYGELAGIPAARRLFAEVLGCRPEQVFVGGNSSLQLMYDTICKAYTHGLLRSPRPWCKEETVKWLCPVPGYDRHFKVTETFGFELVAIPMTDEGPDMNVVMSYIADPAVKGMWCVPKYSNPTGITYSDETIHSIASMKPAAKDFLLMWDNAYCIHEFEGDFVPFIDILSECERYGNADMVFEFTSTSKVTFPGAGVACFACSEDNMTYMKKLISAQSISYDKVNQLRHVLLLKDREGALAHMRKHARIMSEKVNAVIELLDEHIKPLGIAEYKKPTGGYFISLNVMPGCAKKVFTLMKEAGVVMTTAGATFPYGNDPQDSNLRIAPSYPPIDELRMATQVLCTCVKLAALEKLAN